MSVRRHAANAVHHRSLAEDDHHARGTDHRADGRALRPVDRLGIPLGPGQPPAFLRVYGALLAVDTELFNRPDVHYLSGFFGLLERALRDSGASTTTFALGSAELYAWLDGNDDVAFLADRAVVRTCAVITTPRHHIDVIVTEYGAAELEGMTVQQLGEALAAVAHPQFRDGLVAAAARRDAHRWYEASPFCRERPCLYGDTPPPAVQNRSLAQRGSQGR